MPKQGRSLLAKRLRTTLPINDILLRLNEINKTVRAASIETHSGLPDSEVCEQPRIAHEHAPSIVKAAINLEIFRAESKKEDERCSDFHPEELSVAFARLISLYHNLYRNEGRVEVRGVLYYSHLALGKMLTRYSFANVLEIGSRGGTAARVFQFAGKK